MKQVRMRLIFHNKLPETARIAALQGAREFGKKFDVVCDCAGLNPLSTLRVINGSAISYLLRRTDLKPENLEEKKVRNALARRAVWETICYGQFRPYPKTIIGFGIAPGGLISKAEYDHRLMHAISEYEVMGVLGGETGGIEAVKIGLLARYEPAIQTPHERQEIAGRILALSVKRAFGRIYLSSDTCYDAGCVMQEATYAKLAGRIAKRELEVCRKCSRYISARVYDKMIGNPEYR
jgi:hypothetical protein